MARTRKHVLTDILCLATLATIADCDGWDDMVEWAEEHEEWLGTFLELPNGVPSADTIRRVFESIERGAFAAAFEPWTTLLAARGVGGTLSIDGKALRRSFDRAADQRALHVVRAWSVAGNLALGQVTVAQKSNETVAVPELLAQLDLRGMTVTADAASTQVAIAAQIVDGGGDYMLAVRGNQPTLEEQIVGHFAVAVRNDGPSAGVRHHTEMERGHGRIVERTVWIAQASAIPVSERWKGAGLIGYIRCRRGTPDGISEEWRPYITSRTDLSAEAFGALVRSHWAVENNLHWQLDISFHEDSSRIRDQNAAANLSLVRTLALAMLKREKSYTRGIEAKRRKAARSHEYMLKVLAA